MQEILQLSLMRAQYGLVQLAGYTAHFQGIALFISLSFYHYFP